ncbi:MAG: MFS transporter [Clostridiales bacterium]|jgi:MFS family permease|nr:MFS transporter [Clostridiales bacterium]
MENTTENARLSPRFSFWKTVNVGLAFFTVCIFWQVYNSIMPLFLKDYDLSKTVTGLIVALGNAVALVMLPLIGNLSDRLPKEWRFLGKRMPFIVVGSVLAAVAFLLINYAHNAYTAASAPDNGTLWILLLFVLLTVTSMALYRTPAVSLMPDVTLKQHRSKANAIINLMGGVGGAIGMALMMFLVKSDYRDVADGTLNAVRVTGADGSERIVEGLRAGANIFPQKYISGDNWTLFIIVSVLMIAAAILLVVLVNENRLVEQKQKQLEKLGIDEDRNAEGKKAAEAVGSPFRNLTGSERKSLTFLLLSVGLWYFAYTALTTHFSDFCWVRLKNDNFALPMLIAQGAAFIAFYPAALLGGRIGRKKTIQIGVLLFIGGSGLGSFLMLPFIGDTALELGMYLVFFLIGAGWAMINVHSFVMSMEFAGKENNGFFTGLYYVACNAAQILTPILAGVFMDLNYSLLLPYSLVFIVLAFVSMLFVKHGNEKKGLYVNGKGKG